jgi:hypothetical protein
MEVRRVRIEVFIFSFYQVYNLSVFIRQSELDKHLVRSKINVGLQRKWRLNWDRLAGIKKTWLAGSSFVDMDIKRPLVDIILRRADFFQINLWFIRLYIDFQPNITKKYYGFFDETEY